MRIGLTGGIGSGKSTASKVFRDLGFNTLSTDEAVHALYAGDAVLRQKLASRFGGGIITKEGDIDRKALAEIVFQDVQARKDLESIVHPMVRDYWLNATANKDERWLVEIPLLFENKLDTLFDHTVCVVVSPSVQTERLKLRGMDIVDAQRRITQQLPLDEKIRRADCVIWNDGSISSLNQQIYFWVSQVLNF